jgi:hypothetical protein
MSVVYLGTVELDEQGETIGLNLPAGVDLDLDTIKAAIEAANKAKAEAALAESARLRELFSIEGKPA